MEKFSKILEGKRKVSVIGAGFVGSSIAYALSIREFAKEIAIIDIVQEKVEGEAKDIQHGIPSMGNAFVYAGTYADVKDSDLIIITAGRGRKPGETRLDLVNSNIAILKNVVDSIKEHYVDSKIMLVANPVDVLVAKTAEWMNVAPGVVFGSGCVLDSSRLICLIANYTGVTSENIKVDVIGEHGDTQFAVWSKATIFNMPIAEYMKKAGLEWTEELMAQMENDARTMGAQIIKAKGKTHYGIATTVCYLAEAILNQEKIITTASSVFAGEYGIEGVALSVPSIVGPNGVEARLSIDLTEKEMEKLQISAKALKDMLDSIG